MRALPTAAWSVFLLDLVVLAQLVYEILAQRGGPTTQAMIPGLTLMLGSGLLGVGIVLVVSSLLRSKAGLCVSLVCSALPLLWVSNAIFQSMWE